MVLVLGFTYLSLALCMLETSPVRVFWILLGFSSWTSSSFTPEEGCAIFGMLGLFLHMNKVSLGDCFASYQYNTLLNKSLAFFKKEKNKSLAWIYICYPSIVSSSLVLSVTFILCIYDCRHIKFNENKSRRIIQTTRGADKLYTWLVSQSQRDSENDTWRRVKGRSATKSLIPTKSKY